MANPPKPLVEGPTDRSEREAAEWLVRIRDGLSGAESDEHIRWLCADPANGIALQRLQTAWTAVGELGSSPELIAIRRRALDTGRSGRPGLHRLNFKIAAAVVAASLVVGGLGFGAWITSGAESNYQTAPGELRTVTLADGSTVSLDENSRVNVVYRPFSREVRLVQGQAEFHVAKNRARPFWVEAAGERVVATGTVFNVDLLSKKVIVTLVEGRVRVSEPAAADAGVIELDPSDRLIVDQSSGSVSKARVNVNDVEAWKQRRLVFESEPLESAIERINRYARRKIVMFAPKAANTPMSGVFRVGESEAFAEDAAAELSLRIERAANGDILLVGG